MNYSVPEPQVDNRVCCKKCGVYFTPDHLRWKSLCRYCRSARGRADQIYNPTPAEIRDECKRIQSGWSRAQFCSRLAIPINRMPRACRVNVSGDGGNEMREIMNEAG